MHVAQVNFLPAPAAWEPDDVLHAWPSLVDVADAVRSSGTRVTVVQLAARDAHLVRDGVDYRFIAAGANEAAAARGVRVAHTLAPWRPEAIHVHGLGFAEASHALARQLPHVPLLLQDHADRPVRRWRRARWRHWYGCASGVAFTAAGLAQPFIEARLFGPLTQWFAIAESSSRFTPGSRADARARTGLHGDPCVLWVGHLQPGKDPLTVLDGVARAAAALPDLQLWCAYGHAPMLAEVERRIAQDARLRGRVHLLGRVGHAQVQQLMRAADLFVSGSRAESCGYALLEALACGATPVVTDIPSFRALTAGGRVGRLWPCGDAARLADALTAAARAPHDRQAVRAHFDGTLSLEALGRQWTHAYAQLQALRWRGVS